MGENRCGDPNPLGLGSSRGCASIRGSSLAQFVKRLSKAQRPGRGVRQCISGFWDQAEEMNG